MPVHNSEIAGIFERVADLLEVGQANPFRVRAYRNAARRIRDLPGSLAEMLEAGEDLSRLPDIGDDLAGKIAEIVDTGHLALLDELGREVPQALVELTRVPGIGPKRARALHEALGIRSLDDLERAAKEGAIAAVPGFGRKTEAGIAEALARGVASKDRFSLAAAEDFAEALLAFVSAIEGVRDAVVAGSYRRRQETVGDIDILVVARNGARVIGAFAGYDEVETVLSRGSTRATVVLRSGLQVDMRVVPKASYGAALHYFTGSKAHNVACRKRAQARGLKLNEYGVFRQKTRRAGATEKAVYAAIGLPWIAPVLREGRGEIEAAEAGRLPRLVELNDIRGDLHAHTDASDGRNALREMAEAAKALGHEYLAITDHSKGQRLANGLNEKRLRRQLAEIDRLNARLRGVRLLKSCEVDILPDGRLDLPDALLAELDIVVVAVHAGFDLAETAQTERIMRAMDNPHVNILAHPTGRLIGARQPYAVDMERLIAAARERGCHLELNAHPMRLDLNDLHCRMAKDMGVKVAISTDAHSTGELRYLRFGVDQAQRGWLEADDVLNTRRWADLAPLLRRG